MKQIRSLFNAIQATYSAPKNPQYAQPTYTRTILGWIARAVMCFERGGWNEDANAFAEFCQDIFETDKVEEAFALPYEMNEERTQDGFFADAQVFLKLAGVALAKQKKKYGEDNWDLFMVQIKAMKGRERERKKNRRNLVGDAEKNLTQIRKGDEGFVQNALSTGRWLWDRYWASKTPAAVQENIDDGADTESSLSWQTLSDAA